MADVVKKKSQRSAPQNTPREIRAAYPYFHKKREKNSANVPFTKKDGTPNPRYSGSFMLPKLSNDPSQCANYLWLWGLACEAAKKMWPTSIDPATNAWVWPVGAQNAVKDGDVPYVSKPKPGVVPKTAEQLAAANAWRKGYWIIEAENFLDTPPQIAKVINGVETKLDAETLNGIPQYKSGDWGVGNIHAYAYENETFGVNYGFDGFCYTRDGELIGGREPQTVQQMFGGVAGLVGATPTAPLPPGAAAAAVAPPATPAPPQHSAPPLAPVAPAPPMPPVGAIPLPPGLPALPPF